MFQKILKKIKPADKEELLVSLKVTSFLELLKKEVKNNEVIIGGSFAKGTWLKGNHDIDVFIAFKNNEEMSNTLEKSIKKSFKKVERIHGSRDYFLVKYKGLNFELVPVLKIEKAEAAENITDVSPMHVYWVKKNSNSFLNDEIRVAKYFLKVHGFYGAETYIGGFSGYVVEILVIHYNGFLKFIKGAAEWKQGKIIDIEGKNKFTNEQKFPLIVIDPVQPERNAAAALTGEKFNALVELCKTMNKKQEEFYFKEKKVNIKKYDLVFKVKVLKGNKDVVGTKILKVFEKIKFQLAAKDFEIVDAGWSWKEEAYLYYNVKKKQLSNYIQHNGPPLHLVQDVESFKNKYKNYKIKNEGKRISVELPRKIKNLRDFTKEILKDEYIKIRIKSIKVM